MEFVDQEEDQDSSLDQGSGDAGYGYPALNRALLAGFVPGAEQTATQARVMQPIGQRIINLATQPGDPAETPLPVIQSFPVAERLDQRRGVEIAPSVSDAGDGNRANGRPSPAENGPVSTSFPQFGSTDDSASVAPTYYGSNVESLVYSPA